jgi:hypothetical protein
VELPRRPVNCWISVRDAPRLSLVAPGSTDQRRTGARALMPLCQGVCWSWVGAAERVADFGEDLAGDVAFEQPEDLLAAGTGGGAAGSVGAGLWSCMRLVKRQNTSDTDQ